MNSYQLLLVLVLVILIAVAFFLHLPDPRSRSRGESPRDGRLARPIYREDAQYWAGGFLYNNPDDPALFVPKRFGLGWTVNLGHPQGKLILVGTLLLPAVLVLVSVLFFGTPAAGCHPSGCYPVP